MKIIVDAFGGDNAPEEIVKGAVDATLKDDNLEIILVGKADKINEVLSSLSYQKEKFEVINAEEVITNEEVPTVAIRRKKDSSLVVALKNLKEREDVGGFVSAGSTGAVLTGAILITGRIKGISRPALAPILPTVNGGNVILCDCGANIDCKPEHLAHFGLMAMSYAQSMLDIKNPRVALLSNGVEDKKGNKLVQDSFKLLKEMKINFVGNMEAREILSGDYDVIVADGFAGNVALKSSEGAVLSLLKIIKQNIMAGGLRSKLGALMLKPCFKNVKKSMDYEGQGGAAFLGVEKVIIKSHGSSMAKSISASIIQAKELAKAKLVDKIKLALSEFNNEK